MLMKNETLGQRKKRKAPVTVVCSLPQEGTLCPCELLITVRRDWGEHTDAFIQMLAHSYATWIRESHFYPTGILTSVQTLTHYTPQVTMYCMVNSKLDDLKLCSTDRNNREVTNVPLRTFATVPLVDLQAKRLYEAFEARLKLRLTEYVRATDRVVCLADDVIKSFNEFMKDPSPDMTFSAPMVESAGYLRSSAADLNRIVHGARHPNIVGETS